MNVLDTKDFIKEVTSKKWDVQMPNKLVFDNKDPLILHKHHAVMVYNIFKAMDDSFKGMNGIRMKDLLKLLGMSVSKPNKEHIIVCLNLFKEEFGLFYDYDKASGIIGFTSMNRLTKNFFSLDRRRVFSIIFKEEDNKVLSISKRTTPLNMICYMKSYQGICNGFYKTQDLVKNCTTHTSLTHADTYHKAKIKKQKKKMPNRCSKELADGTFKKFRSQYWMKVLGIARKNKFAECHRFLSDEGFIEVTKVTYTDENEKLKTENEYKLL